MKQFNLHHPGRDTNAGNTLFSYVFARAYCERHGLDLRTDPWWGEKAFGLQHGPIERELPRRDENSLDPSGEGDVSFRSYCQHQKCLIYTRQQAREWLRFVPSLEAYLRELPIYNDSVVAHLRRGDYLGSGYPCPSVASYERVAASLIATQGHGTLHWVTESDPLPHTGLPDNFSFLPDFYRLMVAPILLRANSTFSWWAAVLAIHQRVYAPIIEGLEGGKEHDCEWVEGNWPRLANLHFTTDLHLE